MDVATLRLIYHFNLAQAVPLEGGTSYAEVARKTGLTERRVRSILRQAATNRIFDEPSPDHVIHTARSALLIHNPNLWDMVGHMTEDAFPSAAKAVEAMEKYPRSEKTNETAFNIAFNTPDPRFVYYEKNEKAQARFAGTMTDVGKMYGFDVVHVVNGFDWAAAGAATVVDVSWTSSMELRICC